MGVEHQVRNQARVPLWYGKRFGTPFPSTGCSADAIARFVVACTCVGVRVRSGAAYEVCAPKGLEDLFAGILRPNPDNPTPDRFGPKCETYIARWPWLRIDSGRGREDDSS